MNSATENVFRASFGLLWILYFGVRLYFQRKVKGAVGEYVYTNKKQEVFLFRLFALAYVVLPLYFITSWIDFAHMALPSGLRWIGALITGIGIVLFGWTHQVLGTNWTAVLALSERQTLITSGPYHYVRHPMYSAFFIIGFGFLFLSANWLIGLVYMGSLLLMYLMRVSKEEDMMIERFGDRYHQYIKTTGRILPRLNK